MCHGDLIIKRSIRTEEELPWSAAGWKISRGYAKTNRVESVEMNPSDGEERGIRRRL